MLPITAKRILHVDNEMMCELVQNILTVDGHEIHMAHTAADALAKFVHQRFDVVFTGSKLPDMQIDEFLKTIKQRDQDQPIVMLSSLPLWPPPFEVSRIILKPFQIRDLRDALADLPN